MASCAGALLNAPLALVDEQGIEGFTLSAACCWRDVVKR